MRERTRILFYDFIPATYRTYLPVVLTDIYLEVERLAIAEC